jgi:hypothetical protein
MCRQFSLFDEHIVKGGNPRDWRFEELRSSPQEGRRDARRWPESTENDERLTPPQGGEPERRRDERRM